MFVFSSSITLLFFGHEGQKPLELRLQEEQDGKEDGGHSPSQVWEPLDCLGFGIEVSPLVLVLGELAIPS